MAVGALQRVVLVATALGLESLALQVALLDMSQGQAAALLSQALLGHAGLLAAALQVAALQVAALQVAALALQAAVLRGYGNLCAVQQLPGPASLVGRVLSQTVLGQLAALAHRPAPGSQYDCQCSNNAVHPVSCIFAP